jgi:sugar phosphate isomerase/epimerase
LWLQSRKGVALEPQKLFILEGYMRFGIMEMQMSLLLPSGDGAGGDMMAKLAGLSHAGMVRAMADAGFPLIELGGDLLLFFPHFYSPQAIEELARLKEERGLSYTVHLPLWSVEPSTPLQPVREGSVRALAQVVRATQPLDPECYVMHATGALAAEFYQMRVPEAGKALLLSQFQNGARQSIQTLLEETGLPSRKLAIETIEFPFDATMDLAEALDLSICFDTGHVLVGFSGPVSFEDALERALPRICELHLHDGPWQGPERRIGYGKDHQALGKGDLDLPFLFNRLRQASWDGPIIFELSVAEAKESLAHLKKLNLL